jgi:signal transduction histidine kinase
MAANVILKLNRLANGIPASKPIHQGIGLRNMKNRASIIDGSLTLGAGDSGAMVTCSFPASDAVPNLSK